MKIVLLAAATALATASPEVSSDNGNLAVRLRRQNSDLRVERQVSVDVATTLAELQSVTIPAIAAHAAIDAREAAFNATLAAMRDMTAQVNSVSDQVLSLAASVDSRLSSFEANYEADMSTQQQESGAQLSHMMESVASSLETASSAAEQQAADLDIRINATIDSLTQNVNNSITLITSAVAGKREGRTYMWSGGCSSQGGGGWQEYCLNRVQINLSMPKFQVNPSNNRRFIARQPGYYNIHYWVASRYCSWAYHCIYIAGRRRTHGYQRQGYHEGGNSWRDLHQDITWPIRPGQDFYGRTYAGCWAAYHSNNDNGDHSRITAVWQGDWNQQGA